MKYRYLAIAIACLFFFTSVSNAQESVPIEDEINVGKVENDLGASREAVRTDDEVIRREEEAIKLDGLNVAQMKELRDQAEKFTFQAEVNRMMKLIINSLYRNKEIFLRELISNASDALDKIRLLSLTDNSVLESTPELTIRIKADKENKMLHITDTGIGMTKQDLINNLGTIAKSGTAEFLTKMQEAASTQELNDMIGQFGVGFYSAFLVADRVIVTTKHNDDKQYIWESDANSFSIVEDPRGNSLKRGTTVTLQLKPEAVDFLEIDTIHNLVRKYSQFINFPIYLWSSKTTTVEEPIEDSETESTEASKDEDAAVEEAPEKETEKTKKVEKTIWDWELINTNKPIWSRKPAEVEEEEYNEFYKTLTKDTKNPLAKVHFIAEGEVTFKSLLFVPETQPSESFSKYGAKNQNIKLYVRRVFITDDFTDLMPNYLNFIQGVVDSDDLPLNVSRETLQQHKLIKVIKKKLIRKALDMMKKIPKEDYAKFWKEYSTNIKLGIVEDPANRTRLSKLLQFHSSHSDELTNLADYVSRMKPKQEHIYYIAGISQEEVKNSPFVERLLAKGYEVLYLVEAVDEYCISNLPEFEGKKFQNVAKEGLQLDKNEKSKEQLETLKKTFEPLTKWLNDEALKDKVAKVVISERLTASPCALVASTFGWTGNMERLVLSNAHQKANDVQSTYYMNQKKTLEINPRHPIMKELLRRVENGKTDEETKNIATMLFRTATLRSGYMLKETSDFASSVESLLRQSMGIPLHEKAEVEDDVDDESSEAGDSEQDQKSTNDEIDEEHDEL